MALTAEERRLRHNEYNRKWKAKNKERVREYRRKYYLSNRESEREYGRNYRRDHPDKIQELKNKYYSLSYLYPTRPWSKWEDMLVLEHAVADMQLSQLIERSLSAIQTRRYELKKKLYQ